MEKKNNILIDNKLKTAKIERKIKKKVKKLRVGSSSLNGRAIKRGGAAIKEKLTFF